LVEVRDAIVDLRSQQERDRQEFRGLEQQITERYDLQIMSSNYTDILPESVDFSPFSLFKHTVKCVHFSDYIR